MSRAEEVASCAAFATTSANPVLLSGDSDRSLTACRTRALARLHVCNISLLSAPLPAHHGRKASPPPTPELEHAEMFGGLRCDSLPNSTAVPTAYCHAATKTLALRGALGNMCSDMNPTTHEDPYLPVTFGVSYSPIYVYVCLQHQSPR